MQQPRRKRPRARLGRDAAADLAPIVRDGVGEDGAVAVEGAYRNGQAGLAKRLEPLARVLVPKVEGAVGALRTIQVKSKAQGGDANDRREARRCSLSWAVAYGGGEGAVGRVEGDAVDSVNVLVVAVALRATASRGEPQGSARARRAAARLDGKASQVTFKSRSRHVKSRSRQVKASQGKSRRTLKAKFLPLSRSCT